MSAVRKPYMTKGSYQDMMKTDMDYQSRNIKHSEMKKPYLDDGTFQDMEATTDANPGMRPPWLNPDDWHLPDTPISNSRILIGGDSFDCYTPDCYCPGETTCINYECYNSSGDKVNIGKSTLTSQRGGISISSVRKGQICLSIPDPNFNFSTAKIVMEGIVNGTKTSAEMWVNKCVGRDVAKCSGCTCGSESIGYTSTQMTTGSSQTLTVVGAVTGCTYNWAITSGGGSLDSSTGVSVTYTAPASNANCTNNPTITMSCGSTLKGTLKIAVNADTGPEPAFMVTECVDGWEAFCGAGNIFKIIAFDIYSCNGTLLGTGHPPTGGCTAGPPDICACGTAMAWCANVNHWYEGDGSTPCSLGTCDRRTSTMLANGCCPAALL